MIEKTVSFSGQLASSSVLQDLKERINTAFSSASLDTTTPAAGTKITFSDLNNVYSSARSAMFNISGSFGSRSLSNFVNQSLSGMHGIGVVEKTVGDLEQLCSSFFSTNKVANNFGFNSSFAAATNSSNFSGVFSGNYSSYGYVSCDTNYFSYNSGNRSSYSPASQSCSSNNGGNYTSFTSARNSSNFSSFNSSGKSGNHNNFSPFHYTNFASGNYYAFHSTINKGNFSSNGNRSNCSFTAARQTCTGDNGGHFSPVTSASNESNFSGNTGSGGGYFTGSCFSFGSFSTNRSSFTEASNSTNFSGNFNSNFSSNAFTCIAVHNNFNVEGVDF